MKLRNFFFLFSLLFCASSLDAQFYYFGRNKVQYTEFDWHVLRTEHFNVYYYPEMKELAEQGAYFAEQSYRLLESKFNQTIAGRIPLIFYSSHLHFEQTNTTPGFIPEGVGGFFEFLKGRVVIPADGSLAQFRHVIRHELVHVFMTSKLNRVLSDHRLPSDRTAPLWFTEGLAEAWSTEWDDQAEMVIRDAVLNNYIVPLSEMDKIYGTFLMYKEGQNIIRFIEQRYGDEKILLLMENFWRSSSFNDVMQATIGKNYERFDEEWLYALKKQYYPLLASSDYAAHSARLLVKYGFNSKPAFYNNDGKREVYFIGNYTGYTSIYKIPLDSAGIVHEPELVVAGEHSEEYEAFHLFQSKLSIAHDGRLAFVTKSGEADALHIWNVKSHSEIASYQFRNLVALESPSWSPDGTQLAFASVDKAGKRDLYIYTPKTESLVRLTRDVYDDRDPVWSPDGKFIVFSSDRDAYGMEYVYNLFEYDLSSGKILCVTAGKENYYSPSFSPDGKYLTFTSNADGAQNIWAIRTADMKQSAGGGLLYAMRKVTSFSNAAFDPVWTDNDKLVFAGFENYSFRIYSIDSVTERIDSSNVQHEFTPSLYAAEAWSAHSLEADTSVHSVTYKGDYSLDVAQSEVGNDPVFGTSGGAAVALSDILGNDQYYFLLYNTAQTSDQFLESFNVAVSRISLSQRTNYATGIFHLSGLRYDLTDPDLYYYERAFGGYFALSYPLSTFERLEASVSLANSDKELFTSIRPLKALLVSNTVSFVHDNSLWGPTGPLDGSRFIATLGYTTDIQYSNVNYYTVIVDYRKYFRLSQRSAFASRFEALLNDGREARRFIMGGSWDLRGYPRWSIRGKKMWLTSQELRFPFIDQVGVRFPFGGIGLGAVRGAVFFDAGNAWDDRYTTTLGSIGGGVRINIGGVLVLRYDVGKQIQDNFTTLQHGLFYQFFFGWDF
ncbi:MAG: PD40 domain-containing protein [Bacteroidota bacterium]|nr:PD40 domain-containing protein [Bacteroidota bacterium]